MKESIEVFTCYGVHSDVTAEFLISAPSITSPSKDTNYFAIREVYIDYDTPVCYPDLAAYGCTACTDTCGTCEFGVPTKCLTCNVYQNRELSADACVCMASTYENTSNNVCELCDISCATCSAAGEASCLACSGNRVLSEGVCECPTGYYNTGKPSCSQCYSLRCSACTGASPGECTACTSGYFWVDSLAECVQICPEGFYADSNTQTCKPCNSICNGCSGAGVAACE